MRPPQANIPQTKLERDQIAAIVRGYVQRYRPVPPMPVDELREHADRIVDRRERRRRRTATTSACCSTTRCGATRWPRAVTSAGCCCCRSACASRRKCPAPFDEFGLLCKQCGLCSIQDLQAEAERLGYAVLVAEGSAIVMSLIQTGKIEAIVGVSCLSVLERAFPYMEAAAIPGVAMPLLQDDCIDTTVDIDWVWDDIHLTSDDQTRRLDLDAHPPRSRDAGSRPTRSTRSWARPTGETEQIAREWLGRRPASAGGRSSPSAPIQALARRPATAGIPDDLRKAASPSNASTRPRSSTTTSRTTTPRATASRRCTRSTAWPSR